MAALPTPRLPRSSPRRQPAVPTQQLRQQAIANCLEMCKEQGFCPEEDAQPVSLGPDACQYVDAVHKLCALKADILVRQDADLYGTLCSQADLDMKVGVLAVPTAYMHLLIYLSCFSILPSPHLSFTSLQAGKLNDAQAALSMVVDNQVRQEKHSKTGFCADCKSQYTC